MRWALYIIPCDVRGNILAAMESEMTQAITASLKLIFVCQNTELQLSTNELTDTVPCK